MWKFALSAGVGLSIIAGSLAVSAPANAFTLHNYSTGYCLAVSAANKAEGTAMIMWQCNSSDPSQQWGWGAANLAFPQPTDSSSQTGTEFFTNVSPPMTNGKPTQWILGVANGNNFWFNGQTAIDWAPTGESNQLWQAFYTMNDQYGNPCYSLRNQNHVSTAPKVLGVSGGRLTQGAQVIMWSQFLDMTGGPDYPGHPDQYWCVYNN